MTGFAGRHSVALIKALVGLQVFLLVAMLLTPAASLAADPRDDPGGSAPPSAEPSPEPTAEPSAEPTAEPTAEPSAEPTAEPTSEATSDPTVEPTAAPTPDPTVAPTPEPTVEPTPDATPDPTPAPTPDPTPAPTATSPAPVSAPTIASDKEDYAPSELVTLSGSGWQPGELVHLIINDDAGSSWSRIIDITANADGEVTDQFHLPNWFVANYSVSASGPNSGSATTTFTDGSVRVRTNGTATEKAHIAWTLYNTVDCSGTASTSGVIDADTGGSGTDVPGGASDTQSLRLVTDPIAGYVFDSWSNGSFNPTTSANTCLTGSNSTQNTRVNFTAVVARNTTTALARTVGAASVSYGSTLTFTATVAATGGSPNGVGSVTFKDGAATICNAVPLTSNQAACTTTSLTVAGSPHSITAQYSGGVSGTLQFNASSSGTVTQTITTKALTITAANQTKAYGSTVTFDTTTPSTDFSVVGLVNGDTVASVSLASAGAAATATVAGSPYTITVSAAVGTGLTNYAIGYVSGSLTITTKALSITAANQTKTYGSTVTFDTTTPSTDFSVVGLVNGDTVASVSLASAGAAATATVAGSPYTITVSAAVGTGLTNYAIGYVSGSLTITTKALSITAANQTKAYGSTVTFDTTTPSTDFSVVGLVNGDTVASVSLASAGAAATATVAGSPYTITVSAAVGTGLTNYAIGYVSGSLTITTKALSITAANQTKAYGSTVTFDTTTPSTDFSVVGLVNGDTVASVSLASAGAAATATVAGSPYTITVSAAVGTGLTNYAIGYVSGSLTITTKALSITAANQTKTYGSTFTFDETTPSTHFSVSGLVNGDTVDSIVLTSAGAAAGATVAGSPYPIVPSAADGTGLDNYTISYFNGSLTVTPKALSITAANQTKTYGSTFTFDETTPSTHFSVSGLVNGDTVDSIVLTSAGAAAGATVAGSPYPIVPSAADGTGLDNYTISYFNGSLTVTPKALSITAANQTKTYGSTFTFDETTPSTHFSVSGLVNGDTVDSIVLTSAGAAAGATVAGSPYPIVPSAADGTGLDNYTISYFNGSLTVTPKALSITAANQTKTYGSTFTFDETTPSTHFSVSGLVNGDTVDSIVLTSAGAAAGATVAGSPYPIVPSAADGTGLDNYTISYFNGSLTVTPKALSITAANQTKTYGSTFTFDETTPSTHFSVSGLVNGDTVDSIVLTSAGAAAGATVAGSPYPIVPSAADGTGLDNYTISYFNGSLTVTPKALSITAANQTKTYGSTFTFDETTPSTHFSVSGLVNGDTVDSIVLTSAGAAAGATVAGSPYPIVPSAADGTGLDNYTISYFNGSLTVTPKALSITAANQTKTYGSTFTFDETTPSTHFSVSGLVNGDTVDSIVLTSAGAAAGATVAGSPYPIVPSAADGTGLDNYTISYFNGSLTVTPKALSITAANQTKTYGSTFTFDETTPSTHFSVSGLVNGDTVDSIVLTSAGAAAGATVAGSPYPIVPSAADGTGLDNYTISYFNGSLTVTPKALSITAANQTKTYGSTFTFDETTPSTHFSVSGLVNGDTVDSIVLTSAGAAAGATVAGSPYPIVPSAADGTGLDNYTISYFNGSLTVTPKALSITAANQTKTYGSTFTFDETTPSTHFSVSGLVNGDTVDSIVLTSAGAAAGATVAGSPYPIVPSAADGTGLDNYTISYFNGSLTVTPKALSITAANQTKTYGSTFTFDETTPSTHFSVSGLVNGDTVDSIVLTSAGAAAGATVAGSPYPIVPSAADGTGLDNYTISYFNGSLTVTPKALSITAANQTKTYGSTFTFDETTPSTHFSVSGLVNGDTVDSIVLTSAGAAAGATVAGSPYPIVPSAADGTGLDNYTISYFNGSLTVTQAPLTVTPANKTKVYGDVFSAFTGTIVGIKNSDNITATYTSPGSPATASVAGSPYTISASLNDPDAKLGNYAVTLNTGTLTITKASSTTTVSCPVSVVYTGAPLTPCTVTVIGPFLSLAPSATYTNNLLVGTATASYTYAGDANHFGSSDSKTFQILTAFRIVGFDSPVDMTVLGDTRNYNMVKAGQTVPLKFRVYTLSGAEVTSTAGIGAWAKSVNCVTGDIDPTLLPIDSTADNGLKRSGDRFHFNWAVPSGAGKCYQVFIQTVDGATLMVGSVSGTPVLEAYFKSK